MKIDQKFLEDDPGSWNNEPSYLMAIKLVQIIQVTNNTEWPGVALIQEHNRFLTHNEDQLQLLMQNLTEPGHAFPDSKKITLLTKQQLMGCTHDIPALSS